MSEPAPHAQATPGPREIVGRLWLIAGFGLALLILLGITVAAYRQNQRAEGTRHWVTHSFLVLKQALELENKATLMESRHRAYLVQGDPEFLRRRETSYGEALALSEQLAALVADNPAQVARTAAIKQHLQVRHDVMKGVTALVASDGIAVARAHFRPYGSASSDPIRNALAGFREYEERLLVRRSRLAEGDTRQFEWLLGGGMVAVFAIIIVAAYFLLRQLGQSERMRERLALSTADAERALALVDATHDGVFVYDAATLRFVYVNQGASEQVGYSREELLRMGVLDIKRDLDETQFRAMLAPLLAGASRALSFETSHRRKDGSIVPVEVNLRYAALASGEPSIVTVARDISARKQAENERDRFFTLSLDMLCIADGDGYFKRLSPAFTKTLGWSVDELLARPFLDFVHPDDHAATLREVDRQVRAGEQVLRFENRYRHKDGSWRVLSWKSAPQDDGRMYATARDVTESRLAEQRIIDLNAELTARSVALEAANRELEAFSYSVSHDLRAPLRHLNGYALMLLEDAAPVLDAECKRYLQAIGESSRHMGMLIDDLLNLSQLGRKPLVRQQVNMQDLVASAVNDLVGNDRRDAVAPALIEVDPLPPAVGDSALLKQVWVNLLSNAVKYSAPRGAEARIRVRGELDNGSLRYSVSDNGVGFDMRYADKLFGVFQRLHAQDQFEGTGVGLAIVQRIVARHGGRVEATATIDRGATFSFELPMTEVAV